MFGIGREAVVWVRFILWHLRLFLASAQRSLELPRLSAAESVGGCDRCWQCGCCQTVRDLGYDARIGLVFERCLGFLGCVEGGFCFSVGVSIICPCMVDGFFLCLRPFALFVIILAQAIAPFEIRLFTSHLIPFISDCFPFPTFQWRLGRCWPV